MKPNDTDWILLRMNDTPIITLTFPNGYSLTLKKTWIDKLILSDHSFAMGGYMKLTLVIIVPTSEDVEWENMTLVKKQLVAPKWEVVE